jgi:hypothetical protein
MRSLPLDHLDLHDVTFFGQDWGGLVGPRIVAAFRAAGRRGTSRAGDCRHLRNDRAGNGQPPGRSPLMGVTVTMLGTGNPIPDPHRAGPSTLVTAGNTRLLIDAGRGVMMRLTGAGVLPGMLLTHLHSDHITDLNHFITCNWMMSPQPRTLHIYGPRQTQAVVDHPRRQKCSDRR